MSATLIQLFNKHQTDELNPLQITKKGSQRFALFNFLIQKYFQDNKIEVKIINDETLEVKPKPSEKSIYDYYRLSLYKIAAICTKYDESQWPIIIKDHFDNILNIETNQKLLDTLTNKEIIAKLRIVLYPDTKLPDPKAYYTTRILQDDLYATLVVDLGNLITIPQKPALKKLKMTKSEMFDLAFEQTLGNIEYTVYEPEKEDLPVYSIVGNNLFLATMCLHKYTLQEYEGKHGLILILASNEEMNFYPINNREIIDHLPLLVELAHSLYDEAPFYLSTQIYWVQGDNFVWIPAQLIQDTAKTEYQVEFSFPPEFEKLLKLLQSNPN